eukprot:2290241-Lingulodinium_polyedra.AAC.1
MSSNFTGRAPRKFAACQQPFTMWHQYHSRPCLATRFAYSSRLRERAGGGTRTAWAASSVRGSRH